MTATVLPVDVAPVEVVPRRTLLDRVLRDGAGLADEIMSGPAPGALVAPLAAIAAGSAAIFGLAVGLQAGPVQAVLSGIKMPIVLLASGALSLPFLHVACALSGRSVRPDRLAALVLHATASAGVVMAGLVPLAVITWLTFSLGGGIDADWIAYRRLVLATVGVAGLGGFAGAVRLLRHLPVTAAAPWSVVLGLTGLQLSWLLRPLIGMPGQPVVLRPVESTGLTEVIVAALAVLGVS